MKGRRIPEVACGDFDAFLEELFELSTVAVTVGVSEVSPQERTMLVEGFEGGKTHLVLMLRLNFGPYKFIPRLFCGVFHHDATKARAALAQAYQQFSFFGDDVDDVSEVSIWWCRDPHMLSQGQAFLSFGDLCDSPLLFFHAIRLGLISFIEISVEAKHITQVF